MAMDEMRDHSREVSVKKFRVLFFLSVILWFVIVAIGITKEAVR